MSAWLEANDQLAGILLTRDGELLMPFGTLLGGAVIIETVFARQGMGRLAVEAILAKDFPVVQGVVLVAAVMYVLINLAVDVSYGFLDPRIRYD